MLVGRRGREAAALEAAAVEAAAVEAAAVEAAAVGAAGVESAVRGRSGSAITLSAASSVAFSCRNAVSSVLDSWMKPRCAKRTCPTACYGAVR